MECSNCQDLFSQYIDQELDHTQQASFKDHLAECEGCALEWEYFDKTVGLLHAMEPEQAPSDIITGIHNKLEASGSTGWFRKFLHWYLHTDFSVSLPAATATVLIALIAMTFVKNIQDNQGHNSAVVNKTATSQQTADTTTGNNFRVPGRTIVSEYNGNPMGRFSSPASMYPDVSFASTGRDTTPMNSFFPPLPLNAEMNSLLHSIRESHDLNPDIVITVSSDNSQDHEELCRRLAESQNWQTHIYNSDYFMLFLDPHNLEELKGILTDEKVTFSPPWAKHPSFGSPKKLLKVAIKLQ